jgi:hypothetical protein
MNLKSDILHKTMKGKFQFNSITFEEVVFNNLGMSLLTTAFTSTGKKKC